MSEVKRPLEGVKVLELATFILSDLIIGLYRPIKGEIYIDGILLKDENIRSWRIKNRIYSTINISF